MLKGVPRDSRIINPIAKEILALTINDQMQLQLNTQLAPRDAAKLLLNVAMDLVFGYSEALADAVSRGTFKSSEQPIVKGPMS